MIFSTKFFFKVTYLILSASVIGGGVMAADSQTNRVGREELSIKTFDGVNLAGTLTTPENMKALFITLHGSFIQTRDGDLDGAQSWMFPEGAPKRSIFRDLAETLVNRGIGSFRFDKRASGKSGGIYEDTDLEMLAHDANIILAEMRRRFPNLPVGIIGQSEGSLVALKAYEMGSRPDFLVLQGPLLDPIEPFLDFQRTHAAAPFLNDTSGALARRMPYLSAFYQAAYFGDLLAKINKTNEDHYELRLGEWRHKTSLRKYRQYGWSGYDLLKNVRVPTLLVVGTEDGNVNPDVVRKVHDVKQAGEAFQNIEVRILSGLEHSFREIKPGESFVDAMGKPLSDLYISTVVEYFKKTPCERLLAP